MSFKDSSVIYAVKKEALSFDTAAYLCWRDCGTWLLSKLKACSRKQHLQLSTITLNLTSKVKRYLNNEAACEVLSPNISFYTLSAYIRTSTRPVHDVPLDEMWLAKMEPLDISAAPPVLRLYGERGRRCGALTSQPPGAIPDPKIKFSCDSISVSLSPRGGWREWSWIFPGLFTHLLLSLTYESGYEEQRQCEENWTRKMDREFALSEIYLLILCKKNRNNAPFQIDGRSNHSLVLIFSLLAAVVVCIQLVSSCSL